MSSLVTEDTVCQVCFQAAASHMALKHCSACQIAVHTVCYGLDSEHQSLFTCQKCWELGPFELVTCVLCGGQRGAFKRVDETWAHVLCLLFSARYQLNIVKNMLFTLISASQRLSQQCLLCGYDQGEAIKCQYCSSAAHVFCVLSIGKQRWEYADLLSGQRVLLCPNHISPVKIRCICPLPCRDETFTLKCTMCRGQFHTCLQTSPEQPFQCNKCTKWAETRIRLIREYNGSAKALGCWSDLGEGLGILDRLIVGRVVETRAQRLISTASSEDMRELLALAKLMCGKYAGMDQLLRKADISVKLAKRVSELIENYQKEEITAAAIEEIEKTCKSHGLVLFPSLRTAAFHSEVINRIKVLTHTPQRAPLADAQAYLPVALSSLGADSRWVRYLSLAIDKAVEWQGNVKDRLQADNKVEMQEAREMLQKGLKLTLRVTETIEALMGKIAEAEEWEKMLGKLVFPVSQECVPSLHPLLELPIWTQKEAEIASILLQFQAWEQQTAAYFSPTAEPPTLQSLQISISQAYSLIQYISLSNTRIHTIETIYQQTLAWSRKAQEALNSSHPPAYLVPILQEARHLRASPPELETLQIRANINASIAKALESVCAEDYLRALQTQAKAFYADSEYINSLEVRVDLLEEFQGKLKGLLGCNLMETVKPYEEALEEMEGLKLDLKEERGQLEDAIRSVQWVKAANGASDPFRLKQLAEEGLKIRFRIPPFDTTLRQILDLYWAKEWENSDKTLSDLLKYEELQGNCSPVSFISRLARVKAAVGSLEGVSEQSLTELQTLIDCLRTNFSTLEQERVALPPHLHHIQQLMQWADWSQTVQSALEGPIKPSIQSLYALNDQALSLLVPANAPAFQALSASLGQYEQWLSRFCAYQVAKQRSSNTSNFSPYLLLSLQKTLPKPSQSSLKDLIKQAEKLTCNCDSELKILLSDLEKASFWANGVDMLLDRRSLLSLLSAAKRSCQMVKGDAVQKGLEQAVGVYMKEIAVDLENYTTKIGTYFWHFQALEALQGDDKIAEEHWNCLISQIPLLENSQKDPLIVEKVNRQESLRRHLQRFAGNSVSSMEELVGVFSEFKACKVVLSNEDLIQGLMHRASEAIEGFERLWSKGAAEEDINQAWLQLQAVGIPFPDIETALLLAKAKAKDLKEAAIGLLNSGQKCRKELVMDVLENADLVAIRVAEVGRLREVLSTAETALVDIRREMESLSLEVVLKAAERLEGLRVRIEPEETNLREELWKRKVTLALSSPSRPPIPTLQAWEQESLGYGSQERSDLSALLTPHPVPVLKSEYPSGSPEICDYIPPKRGKSQLTPFIDPIRAAALATIETTLIDDYGVPADSASLLAAKLENCLFKQACDYQLSLQTFLDTLKGLANFEEFWEKLMGEGIEWRQVLALTPMDLRRATVLQRLFGRLPKVCLRVDLRKIGNENRGKIGKTEGNKAKMDTSKHFLTDIINDFKVFKGMQHETKKDSDPIPQSEAIEVRPEPPKRPATTPSPAPVKVPKIDSIIPLANAKSDQSNEYSILDCLPATKTAARGRMYDPTMTHLLWKGVIYYCGEAVKVDMYAAEGLSGGKKLPRNGEKVKISGRIKGNELESCLKQSAASGVLSVCWIEASAGSKLVRELREREGGLVIRQEKARLSIYLAVWSETLWKAMEREKLGKSQIRGKIAAFLVHSPDLAKSVEECEALKPENTDEEGDFSLIEAILAKLQSGQTLSSVDLNQLKSILLRHPSPEVSQLIASINAQLNLPGHSESSVTDFLCSQSTAAKPRNPRFLYHTNT